MTVNIDLTQVSSVLAADVTDTAGSGDCPFCSRVGLPILPVRYAVLDRESSAWQAELPWAMATYANDKYPAPGRARYVLRLMREGYLYLYDEARQRWQAWMISSDSRLCEFPPKGKPPTADENAHVEVPCNVTANNLSALLISVPDAEQAKVVHVAYSDHLWTSEMLDAMAANKDGMRDRAMQPFDVSAWLSQQSAPSAMLPGELAQHVPEFSDMDMEGLLKGDCFPFPGPSAQTFLDAEQVVERMNWIVQDTPELIDKGAVLAISDPIGIAASLNQLRNNAKSRLEEYPRKKEIFEKKVTSEIIQGAREAFEKAGAERADANIERIQNGPLIDIEMEGARDFEALSEQEQQERLGRMNDIQRERLRKAQQDLEELRAAQERNAPVYRDNVIEQSWAKYLACYDEPARSAFDAEYHAYIETEQETIDQLATVHAQWMLSRALSDAMVSYDAQSLENGQVYEEAVAAMSTGMAVTAAGSQVLSQLLERGIDDLDSFIWRALFSNHQPAIDKVSEYVEGAANWGGKVIGPLRGMLAIDQSHRSKVENLIADISGVLGQKLGMVSATHIANNALARIWHAVHRARFDKDISLLKYSASAQDMAVMYDQVLWRDEYAVSSMRGNAQRLFPPTEQLPYIQGEKRLWAFIPTELDPQQRAIIEAELIDSIEWRRLAIHNALKPGTWFGIFAAGLEIINAVVAGKALGQENAETSQLERMSNFAAASLALVSAFTGVGNSIALNVAGEAVKERALYKGVAWTSGVTGALGAWIMAGWAAYKGVEAFEEGDEVMMTLYFSTTIASFSASIASLAATAQATGVITSTEAAIGRLVITRAGWGLVAAWLGWPALGIAIITMLLEKNQLEKWLLRCVFGKSGPGGPEKFKDLQAALDTLRKMSE